MPMSTTQHTATVDAEAQAEPALFRRSAAPMILKAVEQQASRASCRRATPAMSA
jgi:hypothetical protein